MNSIVGERSEKAKADFEFIRDLLVLLNDYAVVAYLDGL